MEYSILLDKHENTKSVEVEEQNKFILSIVEQLEIPYEWNGEPTLTIFDKIKLRKVLSQYNISIIDNNAGEVKVYLEQQLIATWHKAFFCLREDRSQIDPEKRIYMEMKCKCNSVFEQTNPEQ